MRSSGWKRRLLWPFCVGLAALGLSGPAARAQQSCPLPLPGPIVSPYSPLLPLPVPPSTPGTPPAGQDVGAPVPPSPETAGLGELGIGGAAGEGAYFAAAPNMQGNLLRNSRSVGYFLNRSQSGVLANVFGATSVVNAAVADNASPMPRDRIAFRYNHFSESQSITGLSNAPPIFNGALGVGVRTQQQEIRTFDSDIYTFQF